MTRRRALIGSQIGSLIGSLIRSLIRRLAGRLVIVLATGLGMSILGTALFAQSSPPANPRGTGIICWSDKNGRQVGCGYTVPPEYANNPTRELNTRGITVKKSEAVLTGEALRAKQEEDARRKVEEQERAVQRKRDLALLNSYTSEGEIDSRRDRDLQQLDLTIVGLQTSLKQLKATEAELRRRMDTFAKNGKPPPENLTEDMSRAANDVTATERLISQKRNEQEGVRVKYNELRTRFADLTRRETAVK